VLHSFRNVATRHGRTAVIITPAGLEKFFEEVGEPVTDPSSPLEGPPDIERLVAVARKYGMEIPPPLRDTSRPKAWPSGVEEECPHANRGELRRIPLLPCTSVNKGKKKGRGYEPVQRAEAIRQDVESVYRNSEEEFQSYETAAFFYEKGPFNAAEIAAERQAILSGYGADGVGVVRVEKRADRLEAAFRKRTGEAPKTTGKEMSSHMRWLAEEAGIPNEGPFDPHILLLDALLSIAEGSIEAAQRERRELVERYLSRQRRHIAERQRAAEDLPLRGAPQPGALQSAPRARGAAEAPGGQADPVGTGRRAGTRGPPA
jgi:hypothetical protein